jgi:hypothetical protein
LVKIDIALYTESIAAREFAARLNEIGNVNEPTNPRPEGRRDIKIDIVRAICLALLVTIIWCALMHRWTPSAWSTPLEYTDNPERNDDVLFYFAEAKAAMAGDYAPLHAKIFPQLGAPYQANWGDYPTTEQFIMWITGLLARAIGLFAACNFMVLLAHVLAAISMFAVCRALACKWEWSFAFGIAFAVAPYAFSRGEHHLDLTLYWHVPLCLLVTRWLTVGGGVRFGERRFIFAVALAFITGLQNQYYTFMFVQLVLIGGIVQWVRRGWRGFLPSVAICFSSAIAFLLLVFDNLIFLARHGRNPEGLVRTFGLVELYALKLTDLFVPFAGHRFFGAMADHYAHIVFVRGELPMSGYLGLIGIAGLIWLGVDTFIKQIKRTGPMPLEAGQTLWIFLQAGVGGLNALFALSGIYFFRATNRYSIFILALVLIFLARRLSRVLAGRNRLTSFIAATLVLIAIVDQTPPFVTGSQLAEMASTVDSDRQFTGNMESRLPDHAMVFQLPQIDFPEAAVAKRYHHLRPYLFSNRLRFSFGDVKGRHRDEWTRTLASTPPEQAVETLKQHGFSAIYVDRDEYQDRGNAVFESFSKMGFPIFKSPRGDLFCVIIRG